MSNIDYHTISDRELVDRLEKGEMQTNPRFLSLLLCHFIVANNLGSCTVLVKMGVNEQSCRNLR